MPKWGEGYSREKCICSRWKSTGEGTRKVLTRRGRKDEDGRKKGGQDEAAEGAQRLTLGSRLSPCYLLWTSSMEATGSW